MLKYTKKTWIRYLILLINSDFEEYEEHDLRIPD